MGTKNNPGEFDCLAKALPDEPMFVLLARDPLAPELVRQWASRRSMTAETSEFAKLNEARTCAGAMEIWRAANWPARKGEPVEPATISKADHDARVTELLAANNREVERRRAAEKVLADLKPKIASWLEAIVCAVSDFEIDEIGGEVIRAHVRSLEAIIKLAGTTPPRCGDHVLHRPSGETWVVAYSEGNDLCAAGWPDEIAKTSDCEIIKRCTDEEHLVGVIRWIGATDDRRAAAVARLYPLSSSAS